MPSIRSRLFRLIIKTMVAPRFKRAGLSVPAMRDVARELSKRQKLPAGVVVENVEIGPELGAEWLVPAGAPADAAVLFLHGGGLVMGSAKTHRELAGRVALASGCRVFSLDYRLAPEFPFPCAVEDTVQAYRWLLESGFPAERVAIGGDSGGGSLALQSVMALRNRGVMSPSSLFVMSPQVDWLRFDGESYVTRAGRDPWVTREMCEFFGKLYVGDGAGSRDCLSLATMNLAGLPPTLIQVGDDEVLLSD